MQEHSTWNSLNAHPTPDIRDYFWYLHEHAVVHTAAAGLVVMLNYIPHEESQAIWGPIVTSPEMAQIAKQCGHFGVGVRWNDKFGYVESRN